MKVLRWMWVFFFAIFTLFVLCARSWAIENSECFECHADESLTKELPGGKVLSLYVNEEKFNLSVHGQNDISCVDCHSDISELNYEKEVPHSVPLAPVDCSACHEEESDAYAESVHAKARKKGIKNAPNCASCHQYHYTFYISVYNVKEKKKLFCSKCHNPETSHNWLTQKSTHFAHVDCSLCHSLTEGSVSFRLYDFIAMKFLSKDEVAKVLGIKDEKILSSFDSDKNKILDEREIKAFLKELKKGGFSPVLYGEINAVNSPDVHKVTAKALKKCSLCHSPKSEYLKDVNLVISGSKGELISYKVSKATLGSFNTSRFYLIGATKIKWLDIIGFLLIAGGIAFAVGHLFIRIITKPLRRKEE